MSDELAAAAEAIAWMATNGRTNDPYNRYDMTDAFTAGARWAFEQAARIAEEAARRHERGEVNLDGWQSASQLAGCIRALAAGGEAKGDA